MVKAWDDSRPLDGLITTGDNSYSNNYEDDIGTYYKQAFIDTSRFFACIGNHDTDGRKGSGRDDYRAFLKLPSNYYKHSFRGVIDIFVLDTTENMAPQIAWLKCELQSSTAPWKIVIFHYPRYSSGPHGSTSSLRDFAIEDWGAHAGLSGHDHHYERIMVSSRGTNSRTFPYIVNGSGGAGLRAKRRDVENTVFSNYSNHGAMRIVANSTTLLFEYYASTSSSVPVDKLMLRKE